MLNKKTSTGILLINPDIPQKPTHNEEFISDIHTQMYGTI